MANYPGTKLVGVAFELRKRFENSPSCVHVLNKTLNWFISRRRCFAEDGKEMYPKFKTHVQGDCFSSLNLFSFAALSLPSSLLTSLENQTRHKRNSVTRSA